MTQLAATFARYPDAQTFEFGDGPALCAALLAAVRSGTKTATCAALREYEADGEALPIVGRRYIALEWDGRLRWSWRWSRSR